MMTKKEMLDILKTLSAMESATLAAKAHMPDYLLENLLTCCEVLEREILGEKECTNPTTSESARF